MSALAHRPRVLGGLMRLLTALAVLAVPVFCVTTSVRVAVNSLPLYTYGFHRYKVAETTGIAPQELEGVARAFIAYFNGPEEWLTVRARVFGAERSLFNQREVLHMRDVKGLVRGVYRAQEVAGGVLALWLAVGLWAQGRAFVGRVLLLAGGLSIGLLVVAAVALAVAFPWLFTLFHLLSFRNPFWQLDPSRDLLIRLFPEGFWFMATMLVAGASLAQAGIAMLVGWGLLVWGRRPTGAGGGR
ncbi:hypothetical protein HRbin23_00544 [bacterium HR23]|nr:hypothetical protein HRbin23_00544 [bacterium HR23]